MKNLLAGLLLIFGLAARAQTFTPIHNYQQPDGLSLYKYFGVPYGPTPILNVTRTVPGAVFYNTTDSSLYSWTGVQWLRATGGVVISPSPGVDSITISGNVICQWRAGVSTCYALDRFFTDVALSADRLRYIYYNFMGDSLKTVDIPHTIAEQGAGMILTRRGDTINFAASGTGGTVPKFTPTAVPFATSDSTLGEDQPGLNYNGTNLAVGHNNFAAQSGITINGSRGLVLADIGGLYISAGGNATIGVPDATKHVKLQNNSNTLVDIYADGNTMEGLHTNIKTDVLIDSLKTTGTAPASAGTDRMVTTDINGKLSFAPIPTPGSSVSLTAGLGMAASPSTITGSGSFALDSASAVVLSRARAAATYQPLITGTGFVKSTAGTITYDNSTYQTSNQAVTVTATGDATGTSSASGTAPSIPLVLATVNSNVGSFTNASVTVNAKGLVTAVSNGSGGSSHDSTWINARFGYAPNAIGLLYNTRWNTGSMPTGWAVNASFSSLTTSFTGSKLTVTGGNFWGTAILADAANASAIQFATKRMPYERLDYSMDIVPTTKSAGAVVYLAHARNGLLYSTNETIAWDLSNGAQSGRVGIGADTSITFSSSIDSTSKMVFSANDSLTLYYHKDGWSVTAGIINRTTGKITRTTFNQIWNGSGGLINLGFIKGTYVVTNTNFSTSEEKGKVWIAGDSHEGGSGGSQQSKRWPDVTFGSNQKYFGVWGLPSLSAKYFVSSGLLAELLADAQPSKFINSFSGYNDESEGFGAPATKTAVDSIIYPAVRALGAANVFMTGVPPRTLTTDLYNDSSYSVSVSRGIRWADFRKVLINGTTKQYPPYVYDGVHFNDSGHIKMAQEVTANFGYYILAAAASDSLDVLKFRGLRTAKGTRTAQLVGVESDGTAVTIPNDLPTGATYILNQYNTNPNLVVSQPNAYSQPGRIQISSVVGSDSALMVTNTSELLRIGFNGGTSSNVGNIDINNGGSLGFQTYNNFTGGAAGNVVISAASANRVKSSITNGTFNGAKNNVLINSYTGATMTGNLGNVGIGSSAFAITSGQVNIGIGLNALFGVTGTNQNLEILTSATTNGLGTSSRANTIILGSTDSEGDNYVSNDVVLRPANGLTAVKMWLGGRTATTPVTINAPAGIGTNQPGQDFTFAPGRSTGVGYPGKAIFDFSDINVASASSINSTYKRTMQVERLGVAIGSGTTLTKAPDAALDVITTTQVLLPPRMTSAQRDLIPQGVLTLTNSAIGSGYTNATVLLTFTGGTCSTTPVAYVTVAGGVVQPATIVVTNRGACSVAPTVTLTSGAGTGATFTLALGATTGGMIFCTDCTATDASTGVNQSWNGTTWKNNW